MMHSCPLSAGSNRIWMPGEIEYENSRKIQSEGIEVPPATEKRLITTLRTLGYVDENESLTQLIEKFS